MDNYNPKSLDYTVVYFRINISIASIVFLLQLLYMGVVLYAPALALNQGMQISYYMSRFQYTSGRQQVLFKDQRTS